MCSWGTTTLMLRRHIVLSLDEGNTSGPVFFMLAAAVAGFFGRKAYDKFQDIQKRGRTTGYKSDPPSSSAGVSSKKKKKRK